MKEPSKIIPRSNKLSNNKIPLNNFDFTLTGQVAEVVQNTIVDGVVFMDLEGVVRYINRAGKELLGVKKNVVGIPRIKIISNSDHHLEHKLDYLFDPVRLFKESAKGSIISGLVIKVNSNPIRYLDTTYVPLNDENGKAVGVLADFRDVTLVKNQNDEINNQLKVSSARRKRWDAIFNSVEEGICIVDKNSRVVEFNPALEVMSGYLENEVVGKKYHELFKCHDTRGNLLGDSIITKALMTQEPIAYDEHIHTNRDGSEQWVGTTCVPLYKGDGEIECLIVVRDIDNYKQVEKLKSEFVSIASHELRTPLTIINGYLSLLSSGDLGKMSDPKTADSHEKVINKVFLETKRLSALVEDLLNISRIEDGRLKVEIQHVDLINLIKETVSDYQLLAKSKSLELKFIKPVGNYIVACDSGRIKQVLSNLIDNAIKYTEEGEITVSVKRRGEEAVTSVIDTGSGVPAKLREIIFEKFQQAPGSYLKENKGTGLGLFIVKGIIDLHRGEVWVDSELGRGANFSFSLPLSRGS